MAVEKFIPGRLAHEKKNFPWTQILNDVLQNYTNARAMAVWCHLQSRSADWVVSIPNLTHHFNDIGQNQAYEIFKDLRKVNLLKRIDYKSVDGTHKLTQYIVLNGASFDNEGEFSNIECKPFEQSYPQQPLPDYQDPDYQDPENRDYTNKRALQKKDNTQKKEASLCVKIKHKKKKPSYCPRTHEKIITPEAEQIAKDKRVDVIKVCLKFQDWAKSNGWLRLDWKATFINWMQDERVNHKQTHNTPQKKKPSHCPRTHEKIITPEAEQIAKDKRVDVVKVCLKFQEWAKSNGWLRLDWKAAFINWMQDERVNHKQTHNTPPALRDVTEDRMAQELGGEKYVDEQSVYKPQPVVLGKKRSYRYKDILAEKIGSKYK